MEWRCRCTGRSSSAAGTPGAGPVHLPTHPAPAPPLQAKFRLVYGAKTFSNNNNWLRRKLFEAIGVDPAKVRRWAQCTACV